MTLSICLVPVVYKVLFTDNRDVRVRAVSLRVRAVSLEGRPSSCSRAFFSSIGL